MFFVFAGKGKRNNKSAEKKPFYVRFTLLVSGLCAVAFAVYMAVLLTVSGFVPCSTYIESVGKVSLEAGSEAQRKDFFAQFGFDAESYSCSQVVIPSGGAVFEEYNSLQREQGFDLSSYKGKEALQYIMSLDAKNTEGNTLYGVLTVLKDRVVAVHLTSFVYSEGYSGLLNP